MAWQVAIVLDEIHKVLIREMPVWALETEVRREQAPKIRRSVEGFWPPEPGFTLFQSSGANAPPLEILGNVIETVLEHHPRVTCFDLIGIPASQELNVLMHTINFEFARPSDDGLLFRKPISKIQNIPELVMMLVNGRFGMIFGVHSSGS